MSASSNDPASLITARGAAVAAGDAVHTPAAESVQYTSHGVVLVTGGAERALDALDQLPAPLRVVAFVPNAPDAMAVRSGLRVVAAPITSLSGHLGRFTATTVPVDGEPVDAGRLGWSADRYFDLVLDLNDPPLLAHEVPPIGYFAPGGGVDLAAALDRIRTQPAVSHKPRYFTYRRELCAHAAAGIVGCTRCIDTCPAGAVASAGDEVAFDAFLCQGCATCTAVCPDGAVRYSSPPPETTLERLRAMLDAWRASGVEPPRLVVVSDEGPLGAAIEANLASPVSLPFRIPVLASFGIEAWFAALAWGTGQILLAVGAATPLASRRALRDELAVAHAILSALGEAPERITLSEGAQVPPAAPVTSLGAPATALPMETKRATLYAALDHLAGNGARFAMPISLPAKSSFGTLDVDKERCTLCFACVNLCPTDALSGTGDTLAELHFTESRCVQCGLCEQGCPEKAIRLVPQVRLARRGREAPRVLSSDERFPCVHCGSPFITRRTLMRSMELVKDHPLIQQEGIERLKLCMACRAHATMHDALPGRD